MIASDNRLMPTSIKIEITTKHESRLIQLRSKKIEFGHFRQQSGAKKSKNVVAINYIKISNFEKCRWVVFFQLFLLAKILGPSIP